jgi:hypothetical protein
MDTSGFVLLPHPSHGSPRELSNLPRTDLPDLPDALTPPATSGKSFGDALAGSSPTEELGEGGSGESEPF